MGYRRRVPHLLALLLLLLPACQWLDQEQMPCDTDADCFSGWHCGDSQPELGPHCVEGVAPDDDDTAPDDDDTAPDDDDSIPDEIYNGSWPASAVPDWLQNASTGDNEGAIAADFSLYDQNGDQVSLHAFYGRVILIYSLAGWCSPCRDVAEDSESLYQGRVDGGFMHIHLLAEDASTEPPDQPALQNWADDFGLTMPALADPGWQVSGRWERDAGIPTKVLIDRNMRLAIVDQFVSEAAIDERLDEPVPADAGWE